MGPLSLASEIIFLNYLLPVFCALLRLVLHEIRDIVYHTHCFQLPEHFLRTVPVLTIFGGGDGVGTQPQRLAGREVDV